MQNSFFRFEFKYPIPDFFLERVEQDLLEIGFEQDDAYHTQDFYYVSSVYFDTPQLADYFDKQGGFLQRRKVRARIYNQEIDYSNPGTPSIWLEIKEKYDMMIWKKRVCVTPAEWDKLLTSSQFAYHDIMPRLNEKEKTIFSKFIFLLEYQGRKPYVLVQYRRKAFSYGTSKEPIRITLDYNIAAEKNSLFCKVPSVDVSRKTAIIELKFRETLPWKVQYLLKKYNLKRDAYSKYSNSVDAVRRYIPLSR
jgi:hypothetical protein